MSRWLVVALCVGVILLAWAFVFSPQQPAPAPPATITPYSRDTVTPTLALVPNAAVKGQLITIQGAGWQPNISVTLSLRPGSALVGVPLDLGAAVADSQGRFLVSRPVPKSAVPGAWRITVASVSRLVQIMTVAF